MSENDNRGWLSREDFEQLDKLIGKMGYGGYYDFLQCLKNIASNIGAVYTEDGGAWDLQDIKNIYDIMGILQAWSDKVSWWLMDHPSWIETILKYKQEVKLVNGKSNAS